MKKIVLAFAFIGLLQSCKSNAQETEKVDYPVQKTEAEWKAELTAEQFYILREAGTERPFSSELNNIKEPGTFKCAGCGTPLFKTEHKFNSGTGWPSFDRPIEGNVAYGTDNKLGYTRNEEHCATCGGHLGHVFDDGPRATTGKRHCINGDALIFVPEKSE
ncbi:peptide-methionine (R)-S-oxide reductase [Dokdonia sinensis]|uniref:peptide-methionine (R)-S-oxide reductase n=1 Tax=Dokdonia sinensis TaxID=2479847 RepID=A0A3M0FWU1_9FLAO|nr:peptide-methionine (R)-S-oxide reductase MsrB [Dokdonia sinensis]RMB56928.1 peptide-methionine (R)-S-oxide reductase [Dokdonia sinensis]